VNNTAGKSVRDSTRRSLQPSLPPSLPPSLRTFQTRPAEKDVKEDKVVRDDVRLRFRLTLGRGGREGGRGEDAEAADVPVDIQLQGGTDRPVVLLGGGR